MQKYILLFLFFLHLNGYCQESYKDKEYDKSIYLYQLDFIELNKLPLNKYFEFSKPFSKWETRPLNIAEVWVINSFEPSSTVPNFFWGSFSKYYNLSVNDAQIKPKEFNENAFIGRENIIIKFIQNYSLFEDLQFLINQSDIQILLNQDSLQRVNHLFFENGKYWKYIIPEDSPFPMSDSLIQINDKLFSIQEKKLLVSMMKLNIYSIYKSDNYTAYLVDGLLDNCYGFVYINKSGLKSFGHLFRMQLLEEIKNSFYFFISY